MDTQTPMDMAHGESQEEITKKPMEEITEKEFLKELYVFMKKRDTPIERIPNLGFKQIDLFVMFRTVRDLGGYQQVTSQQLWKQVYNILGGNPRSTSAATCTRRHYEKLLLPYECHVRGILMNVVPNHQPKDFHCANHSKENGDDPRPAKRKLLSIAPHQQNPQNLQTDRPESIFPLPLPYNPYYNPRHTVLPPSSSISSSVLTPHSLPAPQPWFNFHPSNLKLTDRVKEPLEHLRSLAAQYKTSSGLAEPLNLSVKASRLEINSSPVSSFAPPSSSKNPKFLNKPSTLYTPHHQQGVRNEGCETPDGEAGSGDTAFSCPVKAREAYDIDVKALTASSSPTYAPTLRTDGDASSPKTDLTMRKNEDREGSPEVSHILPSFPPETGGKMEIEIPLSVLHHWLRLYGSSAMMHGAKQLPALPAHYGQRIRSDTGGLPTNLTFHTHPQHKSSAAEEDLGPRLNNLPSPTPTIQTASNHLNPTQNPSTSYKPLPSSGILKNAASRDVYPFDQHDFNTSYGSKHAKRWDVYERRTQCPSTQVRTDAGPLKAQQDFAASTSSSEDTVQRGKEDPEVGPAAVLMLNSSSTLLHLTNEEVMKLKKIISSSL